jgi:hypothetical protein
MPSVYYPQLKIVNIILKTILSSKIAGLPVFVVNIRFEIDDNNIIIYDVIL